MAAPAVISAILGLIGSGASIAADVATNSKQNALNQEQYDMYRSPAALMRQYQDAGISPQMVAGNVAGVSGGAPEMQAPVTIGDRLDRSFQNAQTAMSLFLSQKQAENMEANKRRTESETAKNIKSFQIMDEQYRGMRAENIVKEWLANKGLGYREQNALLQNLQGWEDYERKSFINDTLNPLQAVKLRLANRLAQWQLDVGNDLFKRKVYSQLANDASLRHMRTGFNYLNSMRAHNLNLDFEARKLNLDILRHDYERYYNGGKWNGPRPGLGPVDSFIYDQAGPVGLWSSIVVDKLLGKAMNAVIKAIPSSIRKVK